MKITITVQSAKEFEQVSAILRELKLDSETCELRSEACDSPERQGGCAPTSHLAASSYLRGEQVFLAPFTRAHLESSCYRRWLNDLDVTVHLGLAECLRPVSTARLESYHDRQASDATSAFFAVHENDGERFIGTARVSWNWVSRAAEFGRLIGEEDARGKGYGTEVVALLARYCFEVLNLNRLAAGTHGENLAALRSYEKLGFTVEGRLRESWFVGGRYTDGVRVSLLRSEWDRRRAAAERGSDTGRSDTGRSDARFAAEPLRRGDRDTYGAPTPPRADRARGLPPLAGNC